MKKLPKSLHQFFWEVDPTKIDVEKRKKYVIERLLQWGDILAWRWLFDSFSQDEIVVVVKSSKAISSKTANYFAKLLGIPSKEVLCLTEAFQKLHRRHYAW